MTSEGAEPNKNGEKFSAHSDGDDDPVIEKTVVMLEYEKPSIPATHASEENSMVRKGRSDNVKTSEKTDTVSDYAAIRAPVSPLSMDTVEGEPTGRQLQEQMNLYKVCLLDLKKKLLLLWIYFRSELISMVNDGLHLLIFYNQDDLMYIKHDRCDLYLKYSTSEVNLR